MSVAGWPRSGYPCGIALYMTLKMCPNSGLAIVRRASSINSGDCAQRCKVMPIGNNSRGDSTGVGRGSSRVNQRRIDHFRPERLESMPFEYYRATRLSRRFVILGLNLRGSGKIIQSHLLVVAFLLQLEGLCALGLLDADVHLRLRDLHLRLWVRALLNGLCDLRRLLLLGLLLPRFAAFGVDLSTELVCELSELFPLLFQKLKLALVQRVALELVKMHGAMLTDRVHESHNFSRIRHVLRLLALLRLERRHR